MSSARTVSRLELSVASDEKRSFKLLCFSQKSRLRLRLRFDGLRHTPGLQSRLCCFLIWLAADIPEKLWQEQKDSRRTAQQEK